jgi:hypothetical protein
MKVAKSRVLAGGGETCDLLADDFENTDGVELVTHTWTADGTTCLTDACEIDTARANDDSVGGQFGSAGSSSGLLNHSVDTTAYRLVKTFAEQASGTFVAEFAIQFDTTATTNNEQLFSLTDGAHVFDATTMVFLRRQGTALQIRTPPTATWETICGTPCFTADTWHRVEIEVNATAETFNLWIDDTQRATDKPFAVSGDIDRVTIQKRSSADAQPSTWIDTLCIYSGARP